MANGSLDDGMEIKYAVLIINQHRVYSLHVGTSNDMLSIRFHGSSNGTKQHAKIEIRQTINNKPC